MRNARHFILAVLFASAMWSCKADESGKAASAIQSDALAAHIVALSGDALAGRAPATEGSRTARRYIAEVMKKHGLEPGAEGGSWDQEFDVMGITTTAPERTYLARGERSLALERTKDIVLFSGTQTSGASIENAELVFVGYGIEAPEYDWDDYKGADLRGKVLVFMNNDPAGNETDPEFFAGDARLYYGRWSYKYEKAAEKGAAGAIVIHTTPSAGYPFQVVQSSWSGEQFELPAGSGPQVAVKAWTSEEASERIFEFAGKDLAALQAQAETREFRPVPLGIHMSVRLANRVRALRTANVLGLLRGSDPALREQVVVYTAHYDHLGIGTAVEGDSIYNGARDNATGVGAVLEIANAFSELPEPPRRSILFAAVAAEESGLLGSKWYATNPTFVPGKIAANINLDSGNIWGRTRDIEVIGHGKSALDAVVERHAQAQGRTVVPDRNRDKGYYYRSDQFSFAKIGVPAVYLSEGTDMIGREPGWGKARIDEWVAKHYHQPSDEYDPSWDLTGLVEDARLCFLIGFEVAQADAMPGWTPGDEFEAVRKEMIRRAGATAR